MSEEWNRRSDSESETGGMGGSRGGGMGSSETPGWPTDPGAGPSAGGSTGAGAPPPGGPPPLGSDLPPYVPPAGAPLPPAGSDVPPSFAPPGGASPVGAQPPPAYGPPASLPPGGYAPPTAPLPGTEAPPRTGMSANRKILLIVLGLLGVCCIALAVTVFAGGALLSRTVGNSLNTSPEQAAQVGHSILNYKLPPGYREVSAMNLLGNQMVFITREGQPNSLFIMVGKLMAGTAGNEEQFRRQFEDQMSRSMGTSGTGLTPTGTRQLTINGAPVTMTISEGSDRNGQRLRQGVAVFNQGGAAGMLMIMGPVQAWDSNDLTSFLDSIR